ncbi:MAG: PH domain-containing protein [Acidobacteriota bacterium]
MPDLDRRSRAMAFVERVLRIPPPPGPPAGTHDSIRIFRGAPGLYRYQLLVWLGKQIGAGVGLFGGFAVLSIIPDFPYKKVLDVVEAIGLGIYLSALPFTFLMVHLDYKLRWYIVTDRSLRIREGLLKVAERTMSFANIQNLAVQQGPLQRLLGIADLEVHSAGGGGSRRPGHDKKQEDLHVGKFRGVDNAEEIRDAILARVRQLRDSGLGDPDAVHPEVHEAAPLGPIVSSADAVVAARELLGEVKVLRGALFG